jgi:site-specific DNA-methyltransferase (adenine-specific)
VTRREVIGDAELWLGDALDLLPSIGRFDAVVTDPPYMMGSAATRTSRGKDKGFRSRVGEWSNSAYWYAAWFSQCWRSLPRHGSVWVCCNWRSLPVLTLAADQCGASTSSVVVWDKNWLGVGSTLGLRQRYELVAQYGRKDFAITDRSAPDLWTIPWSSQRPHGHESEKPVDLMARCVGLAAGEVILDPFMGVATTGVACVRLGRRFIGIETEERWFDLACRRIEAEVRVPKPEQITFALETAA